MLIDLIILTALLAIHLWGLVGNVLVIIVVLKSPQMKTVTNYFILNLSIADLLVLMVCVSGSAITDIHPVWTMNTLTCKAVPYTLGVAVCASAYSLAAISGGRLMATWFPLRRKVTKSVARRIIVLIWIWAAGLGLPKLFYVDIKISYNSDPQKPLIVCEDVWPTKMTENIYFVVVFLGLFYVFPLSFMFFCYLGIWLRVRRRNVLTDASASQMELVHQRTKASVEKLVIVVVAAFAVSLLPLYVIATWFKLYMPAPLGETEQEVLDCAVLTASWLAYINSCMNPIYYAFFNQNFRFALKRLFRGPPAYTRPRSYPIPRLLNNRNQAAGCRTNWVTLNTALHRSHRRSSQLNSTHHNASDRRVSDVVMLDHESPKLPAIPRSQTF